MLIHFIGTKAQKSDGTIQVSLSQKNFLMYAVILLYSYFVLIL